MEVSKIFFDARFIRHDNHDGISRFSAGVIAALARKAKVVALISDEMQLAQLPPGIEYHLLNDPKNFFKELFVARRINKLGAEVVFSPMQTMGSWFRRYRLILTLHDLIYFSHPTPPKALNPLIRLVWRLFHLSYQPTRMILNRADAIATVSETTKSLMLKNTLTNKSITVIYNSSEEVSPKQDSEVATFSSRATDPKTLVYMGSFMDYKNVETLVSAMKFLPDYELQLLSRVSNQRKNQLQQGLSTIGGSVRFFDGVSDRQYQQHLQKATALVTASKDEGFGIPLVEAMSLGVPIVVSQLDIFQEIAADAALYFEAENPLDFAYQVKKLDDETTWKYQSAKCAERAKIFSWENSADELLAMISRL